ncbi:AroM family protein [Erwinia mallotivora]
MAHFLNNPPLPAQSALLPEADATLSMPVAPFGATGEIPGSDQAIANFAGSNSMKHTLATVTLGIAPQGDLHPLLLEHLPEEQIAHFGLLNGLSSAEIEQRYAPVSGEKVTMTHTEDGSFVILSADKVSHALQELVKTLEHQGFSTILILCAGEYKNLVADRAVLIEPYRILPPLVNAITGDNQVGIMVAREEYIGEQRYKWRSLTMKPHFAVASPWETSEDQLIDAALKLQEQGADVVVLDCLGYHQRHRDFLQKLLGIPVVLSNMLIARLAADLLV